MNYKWIYLGVVYFFLIGIIADIASSFLYLIAVTLKLDIIYVPISMLALSIVMLCIFCFYLKKAPKVTPWIFLSFIVVNVIVVNLIPYDDLSQAYSQVELGMAYSYINGIKQVFLFLLSIIAYFKYYRLKI